MASHTQPCSSVTVDAAGYVGHMYGSADAADPSLSDETNRLSRVVPSGGWSPLNTGGMVLRGNLETHPYSFLTRSISLWGMTPHVSETALAVVVVVVVVVGQGGTTSDG